MEKISTDENPIDMMTKTLSRTRFSYCKKLVKAIESEEWFHRKLLEEEEANLRLIVD